METNQETAAWCVEEELVDANERRLFIRAVNISHLGSDILVRLTRDDEPSFLTDEGWSDQPQDLRPISVEVDGKDLLIELSTQHIDEITDYEQINVSIAGTDYASTIPWVLQPRRHKPSIHLIASDEEVMLGNTVKLSWRAKYVKNLEARGQWQGPRELSGVEEILPDQVGRHEFVLVDPDQEEETSVSVFVNVVESSSGKINPGQDKDKDQDETKTFWTQHKWKVIAALIVVFTGLLWYLLFFKGDGHKEPPIEPSQSHGEQSPGPGPDMTVDPVLHEPILVEPSPDISMLDVEYLKRLIHEKKFEDNFSTGEIGARQLLTELTGQGNAEAALIAAEALGDPDFTAGLFDSRSYRRAMQYYRLACQDDDVGARDRILNWKSRLKDEYGTHPSEEIRDITEEYIPQLLEECK